MTQYKVKTDSKNVCSPMNFFQLPTIHLFIYMKCFFVHFSVKNRQVLTSTRIDVLISFRMKIYVWWTGTKFYLTRATSLRPALPTIPSWWTFSGSFLKSDWKQDWKYHFQVRDREIIAEFSNSNVATKCCHYPLKFFTCLHQPGGAGLRGSGNGNGSGNIWVRELVSFLIGLVKHVV